MAKRPALGRDRLQDMTEPELKTLMTAMAKAVEKIAEIAGVERPRFALLVFNDPGTSQYICNCERAPMIAALRETADRLEGRDIVEREAFPG